MVVGFKQLLFIDQHHFWFLLRSFCLLLIFLLFGCFTSYCSATPGENTPAAQITQLMDQLKMDQNCIVLTIVTVKACHRNA